MAESINTGLKRKGRKIDVKYLALRKIHGRALKLSNEILTLLRGGYPDGAHSLWRTLYELEIISHFLVRQDYDVSERYIAHADMRRYKEATDYQTYCEKINYELLTKEEFLSIKRRAQDLVTKYGGEYYYERGFEWIPKAILRDRSFRNLEEAVGFSHYRPYYNWSSDSIHGGPKGLFALGVLDDLQIETILIGPSNYGLVDPMHATALSLLRISLNLLSLNPQSRLECLEDFSLKLVDELGEKALKIQIHIEKYESKNPSRQANSPSPPCDK
ncbi:MAG: DUF5677 domain-containing protein [Nitrososphaeraceae archaeon]